MICVPLRSRFGYRVLTVRGFEGPFQLITESHREVFWMVSADMSRVLYVSPGYQRIYGRSCESACELRSSFFDAIHPDDRERVVRETHGRNGSAFEHEYRIIHTDGTTRWIFDRGYPVRDASGAVEYYVGVGQDITERRRVESEHAALAERFELAARATNDGFWDWDMTTGLAWWSDTSYELFGVARGTQPTYDLWASIIHHEDRERVLASFNGAIASGKASWSDEFRFVRVDGEVRECFERAYLLYDANGKATRVGGATMDITRRRALETQLRHVQKMEAMGQLAGGVAHDFNNLLQAMMLDLQQICRVPDMPPKALELAQHIRNATDRASSLTRQLLVFSRRESMQPRRHELDLAIVDLARMLRRILGEDIELQLHLGASNVNILVDPGMLDQVLINLVVNARDAMPRGGALTIITSAATGHARPGHYACVSVRDTGTGMSPEVVSKIFEPFFTTKEPGRGIGLGLSMVFGIVEQHRGWIDVESEPGAGSTFRAYFPIDDGVVDTSGASRARAVRGVETILVVEDDDHVRRALREVLEHEGYRVLLAEDGRAALRLWDVDPSAIKLVLTDLVMPGGMDGVQLASELKRRQPDLKIVFATGHRRGVSLGPEHTLLQKPVNADDLVHAVRTALDA
jgi:two-component system, cell cycle sensor histidine kinase and response regulator CckA